MSSRFIRSTIEIVGTLFRAPQHNAPDAEDMPKSVMVSIEAKGTTFDQVIELLIDQAHVSYTLEASLNYILDPTLRNYTVSAHLHNLPFRTALNMLLKASGKPLTYRIENGVYQIAPKAAPPTEDPRP